MKKDVKLKLAIQAAIKSGSEILKIYNDPNADFSIEKKANNSPLTIADKVSHNIITEFLKPSKLPILSEEGSNIPYSERKKWKEFWLVDPIDGTKEFINKNGEFTVNIALIENQTATMGIIYVPVTSDLYWGVCGEGAWKVKTNEIQNEIYSLKKLATRLPIHRNDNTYRVVGSRSFMNKETEAFIENLREKHPNLEMVSKGSSLKICMVAENYADIYPRFGPTMEWDTAAGSAIANASGKNVTLANNKSSILKYNKKNLLNPFFVVH